LPTPDILAIREGLSKLILFGEFSLQRALTEFVPSVIAKIPRRVELQRDTQTRIIVEPGKMGETPCIRGLRFTVYDLMSYLAAGRTEDEILAEFPDVEKEDFQAVYDFFAHIPDRVSVL
jgi:uncharacterized protein (DUF433 family)